MALAAARIPDRLPSLCRISRHGYAGPCSSPRTATSRISRPVEDAFGADIDYAVLQKTYGARPGSETRCVTPAIEAGVANHVWSVEEIMGLV